MCDRHIVGAEGDIQVGRPLDREIIRATVEGYLAVCSDDYCSWQGLFPGRKSACRAVKTHVERARRSSTYEYHYGQQYPFVIELVDDRTARICPDQELDPLKPWISHRNGQLLERSSTDHPPLDELLHRGDLIESHGPGDGKIYTVSRTRCLGLPAFSIRYVDPDAEPNADGEYSKHDLKYLNNYVSREGGAAAVMLDDFLAFKGRTDAQADLCRWQ